MRNGDDLIAVTVDDPSRRTGGELYPRDVVAVEEIEVRDGQGEEFDGVCREPRSCSWVAGLVVAVRIDGRRINVRRGRTSVRLLVPSDVLRRQQPVVAQAVGECEHAREVTVPVGYRALVPHELDHEASVRLH